MSLIDDAWKPISVPGCSWANYSFKGNSLVVVKRIKNKAHSSMETSELCVLWHLSLTSELLPAAPHTTYSITNERVIGRDWTRQLKLKLNSNQVLTTCCCRAHQQQLAALSPTFFYFHVLPSLLHMFCPRGSHHEKLFWPLSPFPVLLVIHVKCEKGGRLPFMTAKWLCERK